MKTVKTRAIELIERKSRTTWEELTYEMYLNAKFDRAERDAKAGREKPHDQVMQEIDEWLESIGPKKRKTTSAA